MARLFRKASLDRIASPDQLDAMLKVTSPMSWVAIAAATVLSVIVVIWAFLGSIPTTVSLSGALVCEDGSSGGALLVVCCVPAEMVGQLLEGMEADVFLETLDSDAYGHMEAEIVRVDSTITSAQKLENSYGMDETVAEYLTEDSPVIAVVLALKEDQTTASGYYFTREAASDVVLTENALVSAQIVTDESAPIEMVFSVSGS